jgi:hypothetical protein
MDTYADFKASEQARYQREVADNGRSVLVRVHSHRARAKLKVALGGVPGESVNATLSGGWFSWDRPGEFYRLTPAQAKVALTIVGVSRARDTGNLSKCITL